MDPEDFLNATRTEEHARLLIQPSVVSCVGHFTLPGRIDYEVEEVMWSSCSDQGNFVPQSTRGFPLSFPLHNQLTLRDPLARLNMVCISPGDLQQRTKKKQNTMEGIDKWNEHCIGDCC